MVSFAVQALLFGLVYSESVRQPMACGDPVPRGTGALPFTVSPCDFGHTIGVLTVLALSSGRNWHIHRRLAGQGEKQHVSVAIRVFGSLGPANDCAGPC